VSRLKFDKSLVERLERLYATRDVLRRRDLVRTALDAQTGDRVVDVGCGPGFYVNELAEFVGREGSVVGVDVSADMLAVASTRAEGHDNVSFMRRMRPRFRSPTRASTGRSQFRSWSTSKTCRPR
jgi:predicted TPR repeat methyltransferase